MGRLWRRLGVVLGRLGAVLGRLGGRLAASWAVFGRFWCRLGAVLGRLGGVLGPSWGVLGRSWAGLVASWGLLAAKSQQERGPCEFLCPLGAVLASFLEGFWMVLGMKFQYVSQLIFKYLNMS